MSSFLPFIFIIMVLGVIVLMYFSSRKVLVRRKLKRSPLVHIKEFKDQEVATIQGKVQYAKRPLIAPLSGRPCAHFRIIVEKKVKSKNHSTSQQSSWQKIIEDEQSSPFLILQDGYAAILDHQSRLSYLVEDRKYSSGFLNDASKKLENYLKSHGHRSENLLGFNKTLRYKEGVLEEGEHVAARGIGKWVASSELSLAIDAEKVLLLVAPEDDSLYLSDDPNLIPDPG